MFDIHAYPDTPDTSSYTLAQKRALALRIFRDYWDPAYVSESGDINQKWTTFIQPKKTTPFRIPRMRAIVNSIYPGTPLSVTEWNAAIAGGGRVKLNMAIPIIENGCRPRPSRPVSRRRLRSRRRRSPRRRDRGWRHPS